MKVLIKQRCEIDNTHEILFFKNDKLVLKYICDDEDFTVSPREGGYNLTFSFKVDEIELK